MFTVLPSIAPSISKIAPEFRALSITVRGTDVENVEYAKAVLKEACSSAMENDYPGLTHILKLEERSSENLEPNPTERRVLHLPFESACLKMGGYRALLL